MKVNSINRVKIFYFTNIQNSQHIVKIYLWWNLKHLLLHIFTHKKTHNDLMTCGKIQYMYDLYENIHMQKELDCEIQTL
jgi:hypothetical protein